MLVRDHTQTAQEFLAASDREFAVGPLVHRYVALMLTLLDQEY